MSEFSLTLLARALLAAALGFVLGWEREARGSPAGDRTYALVGLGSSLVTAVGATLFPASAEKVIAGVVTGIGFLGAGLIVRESTGNVRGLTSAAGLWAVAALGIAVGVGEYLVGVALAAAVFVIFAWQRLPLLSRIGHQKKASRQQTEADR